MMEDRLGAPVLALNAVVWWNTLYLDAAVKQIRAHGFPATDGMCARLSPIAHEHIDSLGRCAFTRVDVGEADGGSGGGEGAGGGQTHAGGGAGDEGDLAGEVVGGVHEMSLLTQVRCGPGMDRVRGRPGW